MTSQQEVSLKEFLEVQLQLLGATVERRLDKMNVISMVLVIVVALAIAWLMGVLKL